MSSAGFDTLRFSRGLREVGVPEQQADRQAELMAEAFSTFADELVTRDYFSEVLDARLTRHGAELEQRIVEKMTLRFAEQDAKFEARFAGQDAKFESHDARFSKQDRILLLHTWMLGLITLVLVVPQLQAWLA
ncbi:MAG TPA: hypothetical protein VJ947_08965 [Pseudohaliea sp.]|nr:hypothetical protein [Pseudohaliea sp.]